MDWSFVVINAVVLACIYGTLAIGVSITWSSLGLINMAFGFIFSFAGYGAYLTALHLSKSGVVILAGGILTGALGGLIVCALAFLPLYDKPNFTVRGLIATLAISLFGTQALLWYFGPRVKKIPPVFGYGSIKVFGTSMTYDKVGAVVLSILMLTAVLMWMRSSRRGLEIRAMMQNPHAASIVGIGIRPTGLYVMAITGGLAGLAAVLLSQTYYLQAFSGITPMIKGLAVALCGGLGSVTGVVIAAGILGVNEALTSRLLGGQYVLITQFLLIIVILLIRPRGIGGILDKAREG